MNHFNNGRNAALELIARETLNEQPPRQKRFVAQAHMVDGLVRAAAVDQETYDETLYYFLQQTGRL